MTSSVITEDSPSQPMANGVPDPRSSTQRYGDAVSDIIDLAAGTDDHGTGDIASDAIGNRHR